MRGCSVKNLILFNGGGGDEHGITLITCEYLKGQLQKLANVEIYEVTIHKDGQWTHEARPCHLDLQKNLEIKAQQKIPIHGAIPYVHGYPGETGQLLALLELYGIPYLGAGHESAVLSFNKISTKQWLKEVSLSIAPYLALDHAEELQSSQNFFRQHKSIFVKASNQGSSVGCYFVDREEELEPAIAEALKFSPYVLLEKAIRGRELEVSVYEYQGKLRASLPGEIVIPEGKFYNYEEKYSESSQTQTVSLAKDLPAGIAKEIQSQALRIFRLLKLRDLARVDFFYAEDDGIVFNEVNTFPGLTPISMFPKMLEQNGPSFADWLKDRIEALCA